jgi:murein DD-endopeptidase MepM/ murein hydrolase activator NlpD
LTHHAAAQHFPRAARGRRQRVLLALLTVPFLAGIVAAPVAAPGAVRGDELSDARAQQRQLAAKIAEQKKLIARLNGSQASLKVQIQETRDELEGIAEDLAATRRRVNKLVKEVGAVKATYESLVEQLAGLDADLGRIVAHEARKKEELGRHNAELAGRIREAYEVERTSMLETLLSGASFTDLLAEMSMKLDLAEQDRELAEKVAADRATLLELHQTVQATRAETNTLRQQTAVQKQQLDQRLKALRAAQAKLRKLEKAAKAALAAERAQYAKLARDEAKLKKAMAAATAARKKLQRKISRLVAAQFRGGNIPSEFNGTFRWPMAGAISGEFGCSSFGWYAPGYGCAHFHNGIDIVAPYGTPVRASGAGRVVYIGWNYADGADPAWIVVIAHASNLTTWYAHLQSRYPVRAGQTVRKGQVIGYEGNTGRSTGAHLHWMVELNGRWVNPRLFV